MASLAWASVAVAAVANAFAYAFSLYGLTGADKALHAFTLFALSLLAAHRLQADLWGARAVARFGLIVAVGLALGTAWEIAEWTIDSVTAGNLVRGKDDTILDLVFDALGAAAAAAIAVRLR